MKIIQAQSIFMTELNTEDIMLKLGDISGVCYKGYTNPGTDIVTSNRIVGNCVNNHHDSVLEHVSVTVKFITSRDITHELVRHRLASFTQESTRYCNYSNDKFDNEIKVIDIAKYLDDKLDDEERSYIYRQWKTAMRRSEIFYFNMLKEGASPQIARDVLPNSLATTIVVTANLREWKHILELRTATNAHPGIQEIMVPVLEHFQEKLPLIFSDIIIDESVRARFSKL